MGIESEIPVQFDVSTLTYMKLNQYLSAFVNQLSAYGW